MTDQALTLNACSRSLRFHPASRHSDRHADGPASRRRDRAGPGFRAGLYHSRPGTRSRPSAKLMLL
jgi:hypothetical protein